MTITHVPDDQIAVPVYEIGEKERERGEAKNNVENCSCKIENTHCHHEQDGARTHVDYVGYVQGD